MSFWANLELEVFAWTVVVLTVFGLVRHYLSFHEEPKVIAHSNHPVWNLVKFSKPFSEGYSPTVWLCFGTKYFCGSFQTVVHTIFRHLRKEPIVEYNREIFKLSDGGTVALDWAVSSIDPKSSEIYESPQLDDERYPIVFFHHGLCGSSTSQYILSLVNKCLRTQKFRVVVLVARGCGKVPLSTPEGFIAARTLDMRESLNHIYSRYPNSLVYGLGFSLGAGIMAKYIGEEAENCKLAGSAVVSPCWDYLKRSPWSRIWSKSFLAASLVNYTKANIEMFKQNLVIDLDSALDAKCAEIYDKHIVVPTQGYKNVQEYYVKSSPLPLAGKICIPTLSLNSEDDPVCSVIGCPESKYKIGPGLVIIRTKRGGHLAWPKGYDSHSSWMDEVVMAWLHGCHDFQRLYETKSLKTLVLNEHVEVEPLQQQETVCEAENTNIPHQDYWYLCLPKRTERVAMIFLLYSIFHSTTTLLKLVKRLLRARSTLTYQ